MQDVHIDKTLCKQCLQCQEFTYQRTIHHGKRKGELFKFRYCAGNLDVLKKGEWGPDKSVSTGKTYATSTKRFDGRTAHFEKFLKKNPKNVILHLGDTLDLRMKMLREVSKRCEIQSRESEESIFPGVGLTSWYKSNPKWKSHGKKIWWAKVIIREEENYLGNYHTELEAAHTYYSKMEELGLDINKETEAYKIYQKYLRVRKLAEKLSEEIINDYDKHEDVKKEWYIDIITEKLRD